jgi:hypothetical protein
VLRRELDCECNLGGENAQQTSFEVLLVATLTKASLENLEDKKMKDLRTKIERKKRGLEELIIELCAKAKANDHHPNFPKCDACRKASEFVQKAANELFMATVALMEPNK